MLQVFKRHWYRLLLKLMFDRSFQMKYITVLVALFGNLKDVLTIDDWGYSKVDGPDTWGQKYPNCNGKAQSPINIITTNATIDNSLPIFNRSLFYDVPSEMMISNNGHSILVTLTGGNVIPATTKLLPFEAQVAQYHLHWGSVITQGSEHELNGKQYFGELHVVCYNTRYASVERAKTVKDGLAVFAFFIQKGYPQRNHAFQTLLEISLTYAANKGRAIQNVLPTFSIESILPPDSGTYYRYNGSLTTPTCDESVTWTVFQNPIMISEDQAFVMATRFFSSDDDSKLLVGNFRPAQEIHKRNIIRPRSWTQEGETSKFMQHNAGRLVYVYVLALMSTICITIL